MGIDVVLDRESHGDCDLRKKVVLITLFSLIIIGRHTIGRQAKKATLFDPIRCLSDRWGMLRYQQRSDELALFLALIRVLQPLISELYFQNEVQYLPWPTP